MSIKSYDQWKETIKFRLIRPKLCEDADISFLSHITFNKSFRCKNIYFEF